MSNEEWSEKMTELAKTDYTAFRVAALAVASRDDVNMSIRVEMACAALRISRDELQRCAKALKEEGLNELAWVW